MKDQQHGLAQLAMDAVTSGRVKFFPERYAKTYLDWLGEKRDWCISRQLWWGHRIPIWYTNAPEAELKKAFAGRDDVHWRLDEDNGQWLVCALDDIPENILGDKYTLAQDPDVLDTWFSSQLWPHSVFGWPDKTPELAYYYPTSTLVTSRDIITLWVARMVLAGLYNLGEVPFSEVYITPKILDGFGETMSKSKGNGVDPLDIIELYGTDALRFVMVSAAGETQDSRLPVANVCPHCGETVPAKQEHTGLRTKKLACPKCKKAFRPGGPWPENDPELLTAKQGSERFELGRNFANKLWNAARFILMNLEGYTPGTLSIDDLPIEDRWILSRLATTSQRVTESLTSYRFSEVARTIYDFAWSEFCDWYIEMAKGRLREIESSASEPGASATGGRASAQRVLVGVLDGILKLVHPVMPFVSESIWQALNESAFERGLLFPEPAVESVMIAAWPAYPAEWQNPVMETRLARMQELIRVVREVRNRYMVEPRTPLELAVRCPAAVAGDFQSLAVFINLLGGLGKFECGPDVKKPPQSVTQVNPEFEAYVSLKGLIDPVAETKRLEKQLADKQKQLEATKKKLQNADFMARAPKEVVEQQQQQIAELEQQIALIGQTILDLQAG